VAAWATAATRNGWTNRNRITARIEPAMIAESNASGVTTVS
jgi:hypothetical protein